MPGARPRNVRHLPYADLEWEGPAAPLLPFYERAPFTGVVYDLGGHGRLSSETRYADGWEDGTETEWRPDGSKLHEAVHDLSTGTSRYTEWDADGLPVAEALVSGDLLLRRRWDASGRLTEDYVGGTPDAREAAARHPARRRRTRRRERAAPSGELSIVTSHRTEWRGEPLTGIAYDIGRDGRYVSRTEYDDGRRHGTYRALWPGGRTREAGTYRNGARAGWWRRWDEGGTLVAERFHGAEDG